MFSLLYGLSVVKSMCCDAAYNSCGPWSYAPHTNGHLPGEPASRARSLLYCRLCLKKVVLLPTEPTIRGGCLLLFKLVLLLSMLLVKVRRLYPTLQCHAELHVDYQTVADWSQFCHKAVSNFILSYSLQLFLWWLSGRSVVNLWK
jgi:hypothetical protein